MPKEIDGVKYFTQEELDGVITDRLARVEKKPADYDELKSENATLKQQVATHDDALANAKNEGRTEAANELTPLLITGGIREAALTSKFRSPEDAIAHFGDTATVWKDGALDADAVKARLTEIATQKPYLIDAGESTATASEAGIGAAGAGQVKSEPGVSRLAGAFNTTD